MKTAKDFIIKHWNPKVIPGECEVKHFFDEMDRVMQLYSDQQNKELREAIGELINVIKRAGNPSSFDYPTSLIPTILKRSEDLQKVPKIGALRKKYNEQIIQEATKEKDAEIQRLTKEAEELKLRLSGKTFFNPFEEENTRLRELLKRVLKFDYYYNDPADLHAEIDNALNHKP